MKEKDNGNEINSVYALQAIVDYSPESIVLLSREHKVLLFNKSIRESIKSFFGKEMQVGDDFRDFVFPDNFNSYLEAFNKTVNGEASSILDELKYGNQSIWFELTLSPLYKESGEFLGVVVYAKDVDKQKKAEIEVENIAENLEAIIENANESIILVDKNFKVLRFNGVAKERLKLNIKKEIYIGADFKSYIYPGKEGVFFRQFDKALNGSIAEEEVNVTVNNTTVWFRSKMFPVYDREGKLIGVAIFAWNIHERKMAEIALKESEEKFRSIVDSAPSPIIIINKDLNIVLTNPETENVFGYTADELKNKNINLLIPEEFNTTVTRYLDKFKRNPYPVRIGVDNTISAVKKDGQEIFIEASLNKIQVNNEDYTLIMLLDITERIKAERRIIAQLNKLEAISWQQSHEVRKPVANILGIINIFQTIPNLTEEEKEKYLHYLYKATKELDKIIHSIVDYANESEEVKKSKRSVRHTEKPKNEK